MSDRGSRRRRLLDAVDSVGQLARFAPAVADLLAIDEAEARALLDRAVKPGPSLLPTIEARQAPCGLPDHVALVLRVRHGSAIPHHRHFGAERSLVLQGRCIDEPDGAEFGPGDQLDKPAHSTHAIRVLDGPDLLFVTRIEHGLEIAGTIVGRRPEDS